MKRGRCGDGRIISVGAQDVPSAHFWHFAYTEQAVSPSEMRPLTVREPCEPKLDVLETLVVTIIN